MKKNYLKRAIAFVMVGTITAVAISGCGKAGDTSSNNNSGTVAKKETKTYKIKVMGPESANPNVKFADREKYLPWKELDKWYKDAGLDVQFELIAQDQYDVTIQTRMASAMELPDFCNISSLDIATCLNLANKKMILPINEIIDKYSDGTARDFFKKYEFARKTTTASDGNRYWIPNVQRTTYQGKPASTCMMVAVRNDWLKKLNIPAPTNAEEFITTLKTFREKDANGNGAKDEIYATNTIEFASGIAHWFGLPGERIAVDVKNNKVVSPWYMDGVKDYFAYMNRLIKEGLLEQTLIGAKGSVLDQMVAENKVGALYTYALQTWLEPSVKGVSDVLYKPLPPLPAKNGITPISSTEPAELSWGRWAVTKACKEPEGMAKFIDIICSDKFATLAAWGIEGKTFEKKDNIEVFKIKQSDWQESARTGNCPGDQLWGQAMFPKVRFAPMETEINSVEEVKRQYQKDVIFYTPSIANNKDAFMAVPTVEEQARLAQLETNFKTFSKELATNLMLGNRSINDWDQYMKQMKDVGLDEILKIYQACYDRYAKS